ncbi:CooT family nickel-binding protein [Candidatus Hecatella orcuttiae]|jgi:predicted RNA-binding protein|uniref:CooT family nickel-binding protein n=1 Tax=Candidatus Hecatella orcuttiae TaxID=1935119 RepID=UPI0028683633|nr:CooT family nickel-binding protein [Candidatus Hecatella orcuttiae]
MCEFKVYLKNREERIAEDILYACMEEGGTVLRDVIGNWKKVGGVFISEVDVGGEVMKLTPSPLFQELLGFIDSYSRWETCQASLEELESAWGKVKAKGEELIRSLRVKAGDKAG